MSEQEMRETLAEIVRLVREWADRAEASSAEFWQAINDALGDFDATTDERLGDDVRGAR